MPSRNVLRIFFVVLIALSAGTVAAAYATSSGGDANFEGRTQQEIMNDRGDQVVPTADGITVVATDSNSWRGESSDGPRARAELVAFNPNGSIRYYNDTHTRYWDVDPVPGTNATVEYAYADHLPAAQCPDEYNRDGVDDAVWNEYEREHGSVDACTRNGFERVNLTTGEVTPVWSRATPGKEASRYHDVDRINDTHVAVADIFLDRVFVVNVETDETEWVWNARDAFDTGSTGGPYPKDWTHINDVELVEDDRIMVSARNHDRVLFLDRESGELLRDWTLGEEDNYDVIYEQHNPDYIPEANGGPAVIVADSENNRVIEYQRENGEWVESWTWRDARMQWPRDADRLPNGHTLITDSNGNRVFEVDEQGETVWSTKIAFPYESERLGTGDESAGGQSAQQAGIESRSDGPAESFWIGVKNVLPGKYLNGFMYITPTWMGVPQASALLVGVLALIGWGALEAVWLVRGRRLRGGTSESRGD